MRSPKVPWWPGSIKTGGIHVHHLVFGIVLLMLAGFLGFALQPESPWLEILAAAFGVGMGLTLDEFALWLHLEDVYWAEQGRQLGRRGDHGDPAGRRAPARLHALGQPRRPGRCWRPRPPGRVVLAISTIAALKGKYTSAVVGVLVALVGPGGGDPPGETGISLGAASLCGGQRQAGAGDGARRARPQAIPPLAGSDRRGPVPGRAARARLSAGLSPLAAEALGGRERRFAIGVVVEPRRFVVRESRRAGRSHLDLDPAPRAAPELADGDHSAVIADEVDALDLEPELLPRLIPLSRATARSPRGRGRSLRSAAPAACRPRPPRRAARAAPRRRRGCRRRCPAARAPPAPVACSPPRLVVEPLALAGRREGALDVVVEAEVDAEAVLAKLEPLRWSRPRG